MYMYTATQTPTAVTVVDPRGSTPAGRRERDLEARLAVEGLLPWTHPPAFVGSGCVALRPLAIPFTLVILGRAHACACVQARASAAGVCPWSSGRAARLPPAGRRKRRLSVVCAPAAAGTSPPTSSRGHGGGGQALPRGRGDSSTLGGGSVYGGGAYRGGGSSPPVCCRARGYALSPSERRRRLWRPPLRAPRGATSPPWCLSVVASRGTVGRGRQAGRQSAPQPGLPAAHERQTCAVLVCLFFLVCHCS